MRPEKLRFDFNHGESLTPEDLGWIEDRVNGWIKDWTGSFAWACYGASLIALAGVPIALAVRPAFRVTVRRAP